MSCYGTDDTRITIKYSTIAGQEPTIPLSDDHTDGTWLSTDLYIGELFMNSVDDQLWLRTDNGIMPISGTGGSASFIGDFVHISGGTFSGEVYAPTFSANGITASYIISDLFEGGIFNGTFTGDGSGLTGIVADWLGGTVSNPVYFENIVYLDNDIKLNGTITTDNTCIDIQSDVCITGGVSASYFIGDGSGLTNIPLGTQSDTYTEIAELSGNSIVFTRNDAATYNVDLTPLLATQSIGLIAWDEITNTLNIELVGGDVISTTIDTFTSLSSLTTISAPEFYGGTFYGEFVGTFSGAPDIYSTTMSLAGTELIIERNDGITFSTDLSSLAGGATPSLSDVLSTGNTTGNNSIYISSSASQINGYNGIDLHWYDQINPFYGPYFRLETGTGSTTSYIQMSKNTGDMRLVGETNWNQTGPLSDDAYRTVISMAGSTQIFTEERDFLSNTFHYKTALAVGSSGATLETRDFLNDTSALFMTNTDGTTGADVWSLMQAYSDSNLHGSYVKTDWNKITLNSEDNGISFTRMVMDYTDIIVSGTPSFEGIKYDRDYSANYGDRSLVDKEYVDNSSLPLSGSLTVTVAPTQSTSNFNAYRIVGKSFSDNKELDFQHYIPKRSTLSVPFGILPGTFVLATVPLSDSNSDFFEFKYNARKTTTPYGREVGTITAFYDVLTDTVEFSRTGPVAIGDVSGLDFNVIKTGTTLQLTAELTGSSSWEFYTHTTTYPSGFLE